MMKVLLVDDDPNLLAGLRRALLGKPPQWEIHLAKDGREGLDLLAAEDIDLVISDMRMPGINGATFLGHVKEDYPKTVRAILSGYSEIKSSIHSLESAHRFISKPCSPTTLIHVIEQTRGFYEQVPANLRAALADLVTLPSPAETVHAFQDALMTRASAEEVSEIVANDIGLTARMLQLTNSAFFIEAREVIDAKEAVLLLGTDLLRDIFHDVELCSSYISSNVNPPITQILDNGVAVATLAASLTQGEDASVAKTAGLLHDVGSLTFASVPKSALDATETTEQWAIGTWLLAIWGIPGKILEPIYEQRKIPSPLDTKMNAAHAVRIAAAIESRRTPGWSPPFDLPAGYLASLGLNEANIGITTPK